MITTTEDPTSNLTIILRVYPIYGSLRSQTTLCLCYNCLAQSFYIPLLQLYLLSFTPYNLPTTSPRSLAFSPPCWKTLYATTTTTTAATFFSVQIILF